MFAILTSNHAILSTTHMYVCVCVSLQKRAEVFNNVKRAEAASTVMGFFSRQSKEDNCCSLCKREFQSQEELGGLAGLRSLPLHARRSAAGVSAAPAS